MKTFLITTLSIVLLLGCSSKDAFSHFNISQAQKKSEDSLQNSKLYNKQKVNGILNTLYLNRIFPEKYANNEYFYIYLYTKDDSENLKFLLNEQVPIKIEQLSAKNKFSKLTSFNAEWNRYYLVTFKKQGDKLIFTAKSSNYKSDDLIFKKYQ